MGSGCKLYVYAFEQDSTGKSAKRYLGPANAPHVQAALEFNQRQLAAQRYNEEIDLKLKANFEQIAPDLERLHRLTSLVANSKRT